ncbi:NADPH-dependent ferric siderophore reductase, contains FAD-binding and SIP domains [Devosia crocina]|uniref:NADPH-dependent ferric siderophore reductase, contains FAD-binding and SIP domains n=1 Tax=Devosia crocina TaxID=429728 RepID=A0A1I7NR61_9HYPH|nr:siderophore-interacting protein [Devosia crocina]SFV37177.1 NADPH-dependent ferric siderophore reductase, contains FAD-binding and SIP domains [Devosia crocina]
MTEAIDPRALQRVRHDTRLRLLTVTAVTDITPLMRRVRLEGDMTGFVSPAHADHIKAFFFPEGVTPLLPPMGPNGAEFEPGTRPEMRDYTPRYWNVEAGWIELDFVLHGDGPASSWAADVAVGKTLVIGGPRGSIVVPMTFEWYLLVGDETALPAIGRRIEELPDGAPVVAVIEVDAPVEEQRFETRADLDLIYVHRNGAPAGTTSLLLDKVRALNLPTGAAYAYVAGESGMSKSVRQHLVEDRGLNPEWVKAAGYWLLGTADAHEPH